MLLKELSELNGVSGNEEKVREYIINQIRAYADKIYVDALGNLIVYLRGKSSDKKVMVAAHIDEVGAIVSEVTDEGYLKFKLVGGIDERVLVSKNVVVGEKTDGVIGMKAIHLQEKEERKKKAKVSSLCIDIGAKSRDDALKRINIGDYVSFKTEFSEFGENCYKGKALDDRCGCAIMIELARKKYYYDTYLCFTVQEEVGTRGAAVCARRILPDIALVLETTTCSDVYETPEHLKVTDFGGGAALSIVDRGSHSDLFATKKLYKMAKEENISVQYKKTTMGGNDARSIQLVGEGVRTVVVSLPCKYLHSPVSIVSKPDYASAKMVAMKFLDNAFEFFENEEDNRISEP